MVRISGGTLRGRVIQVLPGGWIRPTMGRVREAMFSMLAARIPGATVLDLFAGCGLLGLEALSRGAHRAFFVDLEPKAMQLIKKNVALCGMAAHSMTRRGSALHEKTLSKRKPWADQHDGCHKPFDLVFLDPPYRQGLVVRALQVLAQRDQAEADFLAPGAIVVTEQEAEFDVGVEQGLAESQVSAQNVWHVLQNRRYGDTRIIFWHRPTRGETTL